MVINSVFPSPYSLTHHSQNTSTKMQGAAAHSNMVTIYEEGFSIHIVADRQCFLLFSDDIFQFSYEIEWKIDKPEYSSGTDDAHIVNAVWT